MILIDTNIFLEILLEQDKSEICKKFLNENIGVLNISDFTLHSIGVILFKQNKEDTFLQFISDTLPKTNLLSLPKNNYEEIINAKNKVGLDFDDGYQYSICKLLNLEFVTMDQDFNKVKDIKIHYL